MLVWKLLTRSTRITNFCTFGIQSKNHEKRTPFCTFGIRQKNHEKRFGHASSGWSARRRRRSYKTAALPAMPREVAKRVCTLALCSNSGSKECADSKDKACDARHGVRGVQIARCSASTSKNCKISFFTAPNSKIQLNFVKHDGIVCILIFKCSLICLQLLSKFHY